MTVFLFTLSACNTQEVEKLKGQLTSKGEQVTQLEEQLEHMRQTNASLLDRMSDLSIVSKTGAESIKQSLESMSQQYDFIQNLTSKMQTKDSLNLALVMNLKRSLIDVDDEDIQVEVRGGVVYVSISDNLLFKSGSTKIDKKAKKVLGKIATVINDHDELDILVEGHTDDVPMANSCIMDNWDLSVKRATSVVRVLEQEYLVSPQRIIAAGRSKYIPKSDNDNAEGRSINRRTEIVITPKMDQFFQLLEPPIVQN